jgi:DNA-binding Xre family transcriptional regulator
MAYTTDTRLKLMARSLQKHIGLANELNLQFTAQLLAMSVMEITTKIHGISQQELDALCDRIEEKPASGVQRTIVPLPDFPTRRSRARR